MKALARSQSALNVSTRRCLVESNRDRFVFIITHQYGFLPRRKKKKKPHTTTMIFSYYLYIPRIYGIVMTSGINSYVSLFSLINPRQINGINSKYIYNCF